MLMLGAYLVACIAHPFGPVKERHHAAIGLIPLVVMALYLDHEARKVQRMFRDPPRVEMQPDNVRPSPSRGPPVPFSKIEPYDPKTDRQFKDD